MERDAEMKKCPKCSEELKEKTVERDEQALVAQANPEKGGYFGERPEEYGVSGYGDLYETVTFLVKFLYCQQCGHEEEILAARERKPDV